MNGADQKEVIINTLLHQRNTLYALHKETGITRVDMEMLAFFKVKRFVNFHDLQVFYPHTNVQVIKRALKKLNDTNHLETLRKGVGNQPTYYLISKKGKDVLERFCVMLN